MKPPVQSLLHHSGPAPASAIPLTPVLSMAVWVALLAAAGPAAGQITVNYADGSTVSTAFTPGTNHTLNSLGSGEAVENGVIYGGFFSKTGSGTLTLDGGGHVYHIGVADGTLQLRSNEITTNEGASIGSSKKAELVVTGPGAVLNGSNGSSMRVGTNNGGGSLRIEAGGTVNTLSGTIGRNSTGTALVTGAGSIWWAGLGLTVGSGLAGRGELTVADGGTLITGDTMMTNGSGTSASATVTGAGSKWTITRSFFVGSNGQARLAIENGGTVISAGDLILGWVDGTGEAAVSGAGSLLETPGVMVGDHSGRGILTIADGGTVVTGFAGTGSGNGKLHLDHGTLRATADSSDFLFGYQPGNVLIGNGGVFVDTQVHTIAFANSLQNEAGANGGLTKQGAGVLKLSGQNTWTGDTVVEAGTLQLSENGSLLFMVTDGDATQVAGGGSAVFDGVFKLDLDGVTGGGMMEWTLVDKVSLGSVTFGSGFTISDISGVHSFSEAGGQWSSSDGLWSFNEGTGILSLTAVPEPSSALLALLGAAGAAGLWRRRRITPSRRRS